MPLRESGRPQRPEFEGYAKVQVAIDSGAAASVMPERLLAGHTVAPGEVYSCLLYTSDAADDM
eukprot:9897368-Alexandrium_andersonii.AAC.1